MANCTLHVSGPAMISIGNTWGTGSVLADLGTSIEGVTITIETKYKEVMVDQFGGPDGVPFDTQYMLMSATIDANLVWYDTYNLNAYLNGGDVALAASQGAPQQTITTGTTYAGNTGNKLGYYGNAGQLMIQNGYYRRLVIKSNPSATGLTSLEQCWQFPQAVLIDNQDVKVGTEKTVWKLKWKAFATQASASVGAALFNSSCT